jgi:hypothetical protein
MFVGKILMTVRIESTGSDSFVSVSFSNTQPIFARYENSNGLPRKYLPKSAGAGNIRTQSQTSRS